MSARPCSPWAGGSTTSSRRCSTTQRSRSATRWLPTTRPTNWRSCGASNPRWRPAMSEALDRALPAHEALERRLKRLGLSVDDDWTDRYLLCEHIVEPALARPRQRFEAIARFIRDL